MPPAYFLPPPEHHDSVVTIEAELRCLSNEARAGWKHTCAINVTDAGELVFFPDRIEIGGQPDTVRATSTPPAGTATGWCAMPPA